MVRRLSVSTFWLIPYCNDKELVYYVEGNALEPINGDYLFSELVNSVFTADGDNVKVSVAVKFIDNQTKATQVSQYELTLCKDSNRKIINSILINSLLSNTMQK